MNNAAIQIYKMIDKHPQHIAYEALDEPEFKAVHSRNFAAVDRGYRRHLDTLERTGLVEIDMHYVVGEKSRGYRIADSLDFHEGRPVTAEAKSARHYSSPFNKTLCQFDLDFKTVADEYEGNSYSRLPIERWIGKDFVRKKRRDNQRLYTSMTFLPKKVRQHLTVDGEPVAEVDIKTAQPFFVAVLAGDTDLQEFITSGGDFYDTIFDGDDRAEKKKRWGMLCFWAKRKTSSLTKAARQSLKDKFPQTYRYIFSVDRLDLVRELFRVESSLMVDKVLPDILSAGSTAATVHDCVICPTSDAEIVKERIEDRGKEQFGISPIVEITRGESV